MKKISVLSLVAALFLLFSCNNFRERTESATVDSTVVTDPVLDMPGGESQQDQSPIVNSMNKMMQDMQAMRMTGDADHDFAMMMKRHHESAIEMANYEIDNGKDEKMKQLAQKILDDARTDNMQLENFLRNHTPGNKSDFSTNAMEIMQMMERPMATESNDTDMQFAAMMEEHHQDGIDVANLYIRTAKEPATKKIANNVIKTNTEDIKQLKNWRQLVRTKA